MIYIESKNNKSIKMYRPGYEHVPGRPGYGPGFPPHHPHMTGGYGYGPAVPPHHPPMAGGYGYGPGYRY